MSDFYAQRLEEATGLIEGKYYRQAVETACGAIEHLLQDLYDELTGKLTTNNAKRLLEVQRRVSSGISLDRLTFGKWAILYQDGDVYNLLERELGYQLRYFNAAAVERLVEVRNLAAHEDHQPSRHEAELVRNHLAIFLEETNRAVDEVEQVLPNQRREQGYGTLPAWTTIAEPHKDIRERRFDLGIFAIHLGEVALRQGQSEYADPHAFYNLTYVTRGLESQLVKMLRRLSGDPSAGAVTHLHTTFGGGKTHTMLAMYHLTAYAERLQPRKDVRDLMEAAGIKGLPEDGRVAVLDGSMLDPNNPRQPETGITLHTLWGEIAYQLGGPDLYEIIRKSDQEKSAPGSAVLAEMLAFLDRPVLILVDEMLDYATKAAAVKVGRSYLVDQLQSFLKALTQAVDRTPRAMMVVTLTSSRQEQFGDQAAQLYDGMKRIMERVEVSEVTAENIEIYEILRRRLFHSIGEPERIEEIAEVYWQYYREHDESFPQHVSEPSYRDRITAAYPFHPELIDVLRDRWATIEGFQKTRGVLRLLALVVSNLYRRNHGAPLIQVGHIDLADPEIRQELLNHTYAMSGYDAAIGSDIAGLPESKAENLDERIGGQYYRFGLCEGLATATFMYSQSGRRGFTGATRTQLWLAVLQPDVLPPMAADAFDKLERSMWYLEEEGGFWRLSVTPNLNAMLVERIEAVRNETDEIYRRIYDALEGVVGNRFGRPLIWPEGPRAVRDDQKLKLVVGPLNQPWIEEDEELLAQIYIDDILQNATGTYRQYRNTLVFLMPTHNGVNTIWEAAVKLIALEDIRRTAGDRLNERQWRDFERQYESAQKALPASVWGAYMVIATAAADGLWVDWEYSMGTYRGGQTLSDYVWDRLKNQQQLLEQFDPYFLAKRSDERFGRIWPEGQEAVNVAELWDHFARYDYLPKLAGSHVLQDTIAWGVDRGLFAYCLGDAAELNFDTIYFDKNVQAAQCRILEHAWLVEPEMIRPLLEPETVPDPVPPTDPGTEPDGDGPTPPAQPKRPPEPRERRYRTIDIETQLNALHWRQFHKSVIEPLTEKGAEIGIVLRLHVQHADGLSPDFVELRIKESVLQLDSQADVEVSEE